MKSKPFPTLPASALVWLGALAGLSVALWFGWTLEVSRLYLMVLAYCVVTLGDLLEIDLRGGRATPVSNAVVFALFVVLPTPGEVLFVIIPAFLTALIVRAQDLGWGPRFRSTSRRLATTVGALFAYTAITSFVPSIPGQSGNLLSETLVMLVVGGLYLLVDTGFSSLFIARAHQIPLVPIWRGQIENLAAVHSAFLSVAALMSLAYNVLQEWAFLLFLLPLFAARYSFRRYASIHTTYTQTIRALSKIPELAGFGSPGHSVKVAKVAAAMGRRHGLSDNEVQDLEFAGLLHDVGLLSFEDPSPPGQTKTNRDAIARESASIIEQTPYLSRVAEIVGGQGGPAPLGRSSRATLPSRILRVADAYVELTAGFPQLSPEQALRKIQSRVGDLYDLTCVVSLQGVLEHQGEQILETEAR